jgi:hypothetical protein
MAQESIRPPCCHGNSGEWAEFQTRSRVTSVIPTSSFFDVTNCSGWHTLLTHPAARSGLDCPKRDTVTQRDQSSLALLLGIIIDHHSATYLSGK